MPRKCSVCQSNARISCACHYVFFCSNDCKSSSTHLCKVIEGYKVVGGAFQTKETEVVDRKCSPVGFLGHQLPDLKTISQITAYAHFFFHVIFVTSLAPALFTWTNVILYSCMTNIEIFVNKNTASVYNLTNSTLCIFVTTCAAFFEPFNFQVVIFTVNYLMTFLSHHIETHVLRPKLSVFYSKIHPSKQLIFDLVNIIIIPYIVALSFNVSQLGISSTYTLLNILGCVASYHVLFHFPNK